MTTITLTNQELADIVTQAAKMGAELGIEAALQNTQTQPSKPNGRKTITFKEVELLTGLKQSAIRRRYHKEKKSENLYDPTFPKPHKKGGHVNYWYEDEIINWNEQQAMRGAA